MLDKRMAKLYLGKCLCMRISLSHERAVFSNKHRAIQPDVPRREKIMESLIQCKHCENATIYYGFMSKFHLLISDLSEKRCSVIHGSWLFSVSVFFFASVNEML